MAKVKVKVLAANVDGHTEGEIISIDERSAKHLESIRYVERVSKTAAKDDGDKEDGGDDK